MLGRTKGSATERHGFTLTELLVVIVLLGVLALALLPAHAASRSKSQTVRCLSNLGQIISALMMYTHDNHDFFPPNPDDGTSQIGYNWCQGQAGIGSGQQFNPDILADPARCLITTYLNTNVSLFRCTADLRMGLYQGTDPSKTGTIVPAARTISMNHAVGTIDACFASGSGHCGVPNLPVNGPWLDGHHGNHHDNPWRTYANISQMVVPIPARLSVVLEENPWSINDAALAASAAVPEWIDYPSTLHNMSCIVTFGDGHAEAHKWASAALRLTGPPGFTMVPASDPDWNWFIQRTTARAR